VKHTFPLWVATLWYGLNILKQNAISPWSRATLHLQSESLSDSGELVEQAEQYLRSTAWWGKAYGFDKDADEIIDVWRYLSKEWMTDIQITQMQELLRQRIRDSPQWANRIEVLHLMFFVRLHNTYGTCRDCPSLYDSDENRWLRKLGGLLERGHREYIVGALNINHNHWISVTVNLKDNIIYYGDPMHNECPSWLHVALDWWLAKHLPGSSFRMESLPSLVQEDSYSCGILMMNAVFHLFFPKEYPLLASDQVDSGRLMLFLEIMERHHRMVGTPYDVYALIVLFGFFSQKQSKHECLTADLPSPSHYFPISRITDIFRVINNSNTNHFV
jgi:hypothetical protein